VLGNLQAEFQRAQILERCGGYQQITGTTLRSQNWRFFHDEERETPQTPAATENVAPNNIARGNALKLRITIRETGGINISNLKLRLQYSTSSDFAWAEFVDEDILSKSKSLVLF